MIRTGLFAAATLALTLSGCGGGGGGGGLTTPDGDTFAQAFRYFFGGEVFPTPPGQHDDDAVEAAIAADRGPSETDAFGPFWEFETYDEPFIQVSASGFGGMNGLDIEWECVDGTCAGMTESATDYQAIYAAAKAHMTELYGPPNEVDPDADGEVSRWNEIGFDVTLFIDGPAGDDLGGAGVFFEVPVS